jgi:acyl-CoA thioesterase-1
MKKERSLAGRKVQYGALLVIVQLMVGCSGQAPSQSATSNSVNGSVPVTAPALSADTKLVVAFGDSLYAGYNLDQGKGFAPVLQKVLAARGIKVQVVNAGVSGDTTAAALSRLALTLDGLPRKPDLVLIGLGGNDMLRGLSPAATRANLDAILTELRKRKLGMMLTGMLASPNMGPDYASAFDPIYPALARKYAIPLYPFFLRGVAGHRALQLPDGMHPNDKGVTVVVDGVAPMVATALKH